MNTDKGEWGAALSKCCQSVLNFLHNIWEFGLETLVICCDSVFLIYSQRHLASTVMVTRHITSLDAFECVVRPPGFITSTINPRSHGLACQVFENFSISLFADLDHFRRAHSPPCDLACLLDHAPTHWCKPVVVFCGPVCMYLHPSLRFTSLVLELLRQHTCWVCVIRQIQASLFGETIICLV